MSTPRDSRRQLDRRAMSLLIGASASLLLTRRASAQIISAPSPDWAGVIAAAKQEKKLNLYTAQPIPVVQRIVRGFRQAYPDIEVEYDRGPSGPAMAKIEQERANNVDNGADVWVSTEFGWFTARAREGRLLKPGGPAMSSWPAKYLRQGAVVVVGLEPFILLYNKNQVKDPPKGYADLLRPEFKGTLGTTDIVATVLAAWYDWLEKTQGAGYVEKLRGQNPKLYVGSTPMLQAVASGEITVAAFGVATEAKPMIEQGVPVGYVQPNPSTGIEYFTAAFAWSKRPNAALVFIDYLMSQAGQTDWHGRGESASPRSGIAGSLDAASVAPWDPTAYPPDAAKAAIEHWKSVLR